MSGAHSERRTRSLKGRARQRRAATGPRPRPVNSSGERVSFKAGRVVPAWQKCLTLVAADALRALNSRHNWLIVVLVLAGSLACDRARLNLSVGAPSQLGASCKVRKSLWARSGSSQPPLASVAATRRRKPNEVDAARSAHLTEGDSSR